MELKYSLNKSILIEAKETCRIPVSVERCPLDSDSQLCLYDTCKSHLLEQVNLEFNVIGSCESRGMALIGNIPWNSVMLDTILMSPLQWEVGFNKNVLPVDKPDFACKVGDFVTFNVQLSNVSKRPLKSLCLWVQLFQDHQNGSRNYRLDMKRALHGRDKVFIHEVRSTRLIYIIETNNYVLTGPPAKPIQS